MKINYYYVRDPQTGAFKKRKSNMLSAYCLGFLALTVATSERILGKYFDLNYLFWISLIGLIGSSAVITIVTIQKIRENNGNPFKALDAYDLEEAIKTKLVESSNLKRLKDVQRLQVPWVHISFSEDQIIVEVAKISTLKASSKDDLAEIIESVLVGKFANFAVDRRTITENRKEFLFYCEDVATSQLWQPQTINELKQRPYLLKLQKDLTIDFSKVPSIACFGKAGSGKSTVLLSITAQLLTTNPQTQIIFLDAKNEYSSMDSFYPKQCFFTDADGIEQALEVVVNNEIPRRQKVLKQAVKQHNVFGLTGKQLGLSPLVILADEIGNLVTTPKQRKHIGELLTTIVQRGRSLGVIIVYGTQDPSVSSSLSVLPTGAVSSIGTKIILGSTTPIVQREVFGESIDQSGKSGTIYVPNFRGYYITEGMDKPKPFYVPDLRTAGLNNPKAFKQLYQFSNTKNANQLIKDLTNI